MADHLRPGDYEALARVRFHIRSFLDFSQSAAREADITPQQHQVLLGIKALGIDQPVVIRALADWLRLQHHSVIGLIDRLERRGLVRRGRSASDRRCVVLRLTRAGESLLADLSRAHRRELRAAAPSLVTALSQLVSDL
jgi:DNA-binding MarR family transcriptional regulator